jgi:hypothetical protein
MFICDTPARASIQGTKAHNGYNGCRRCIEEGEFIDNRMTFSGVDCASQTAGNNSTVTEESIVLFLHPIVQGICFKKLVEILNSCQTIVRQKKAYFSIIMYVQAFGRQFLKKLIAVANNLSNI